MEKNKRPVIGVNASYLEDEHRWYRVPENYIRAIYDCGGLPLIFPCTADRDMLEAYIARTDGMLFTGGADYPPSRYGENPHALTAPMNERRADTDMLLADMVLNGTGLPVLGICAGHQLLAIAGGGKLIQHLDTAAAHAGNHDKSHTVDIKDGKWLKSIFNTTSIIVNSNHHQAVDPQHVPGNYDISAVSRSDGVIEAMEMRGERFVLGLQWHPERVDDQDHRRAIFEFFIEKTRERILTE